jgi:hypothetical protein
MFNNERQKNLALGSQMRMATPISMLSGKSPKELVDRPITGLDGVRGSRARSSKMIHGILHWCMGESPKEMLQDLCGG